MAVDMLAFSPDARRRIDAELMDDEEVLWTGLDQPDHAGRRSSGARSIILLATALLPTMFFILVGWLVMQWLPMMGYVLMGVAAFCLIFPIIILVGVSRARAAARNRCWVLTNRGLLGVLQTGDRGVIHAQPHQIDSFGLSPEGDQRGTIVVEWHDRDIKDDAQLVCVEHAEAAIDILNQLAPGKQEEL
jgi:hypothetical protein